MGASAQIGDTTMTIRVKMTNSHGWLKLEVPASFRPKTDENFCYDGIARAFPGVPTTAPFPKVLEMVFTKRKNECSSALSNCSGSRAQAFRSHRHPKIDSNNPGWSFDMTTDDVLRKLWRMGYRYCHIEY